MALGLALLLASPVHATVIGKPVPAGTVSLPYIQWSASANGGLGGWVIVGTYPLSHLGPQAANTVLAGPASGATAAAVTARVLVAADLPSQINTSGFVSNGTFPSTGGLALYAGAVTNPAYPGTGPATYAGTAYLVPAFNSGGVVVGVATTSGQGFISPGQMRADGGFNTSTTGSGMILTNFEVNRANSIHIKFLDASAIFHITADSNFSVPVVMVDGANSPAQTTLAVRAASGQTVALIDTTSSTSSTHYFQVMPTGHLILGGTAPAAAIGAAASAVTVSTTATDARGVLTCTMIASPTAGQAITIVTFAAAYAAAPVVVISPSSAGAVSAGAYVSAVSTTGFTVTEANAGPASGTVAVSYMVLQ